MSASSYLVQSLATERADRIRAAAATSPMTRSIIADESPGFPCRHCLRDAEIGDEVLLASYDPFETESSYRAASPIYIHTSPCPPAAVGARVLPTSLTSRVLSVRAFDDAAQMVNAVVIDGTRLDDVAVELLADPTVQRLHVHNAAPGCWAVTIVRNERH